ncbi:MAG: hypothetical protein LBH96_06790 [Candidatus Peribacteria bacterium]|jgi:6-pyruvoyl-tetrahydropterin synthase|nr:hypothetical protein [Candidatus Peribacteria bacterium]
MANSLIDSILEINDVQALQVDFSQLQKIPRETAEKFQIILYYKDPDNFVYLLTTNNYPEELAKITKQLTNQGLKTKVFYTSVEGFLEAINRYDQLAKREEQQQTEQRIQQQAEGKSALQIIKQLYEKRLTMDP